MTWPPEDPARQRDSARRQRHRVPPPDEAVFTSGSLLNPTSPASLHTLRHRGPQPYRARVSPYHDDYDDHEQVKDNDDDDDDDDDDRPLGALVSRVGSLSARRGAEALQLSHEDGEPEPGIRVRRGSEGYEVRPLAQPTGWDRQASDDEGDWEVEDEGWVGGVTSVREGLVDQDGDEVREGPRYNVYDPEEGSEDWSGSEESWE